MLCLSEVAETIVLGIGNPLRSDDGIGPAVIEWLRKHELPQDVEVIDGGTAGLDLVAMMMSHRRAIIVDAANMNRTPGEWVRFTPDIVQLKNNDLKVSLHNAGLTEALALGAALGTLPDEVIVYGVQPARIDWSVGLSDEAQTAVPRVGDAILREINRAP
jgi:hydrogenase maturation protease